MNINSPDDFWQQTRAYRKTKTPSSKEEGVRE
jgi:hypothetical protein